MVDIIDVGMGNVYSVRNNLSRLGVSCRIIDDPNALTSPIIILPGVGSALSFMNNIRAKNFDKAIQTHIIKGNKIIGICLGFQVMTEFSEEDGGIACLGLIKTETISLQRHYPSSNHNQWEKFSLRKEDLSLSKNHISIFNSRKRVINGRVFYNHGMELKYPITKSISNQLIRPILLPTPLCTAKIILLAFSSIPRKANSLVWMFFHFSFKQL